MSYMVGYALNLKRPILDQQAPVNKCKAKKTRGELDRFILPNSNGDSEKKVLRTRRGPGRPLKVRSSVADPDQFNSTL